MSHESAADHPRRRSFMFIASLEPSRTISDAPWMHCTRSLRRPVSKTFIRRRVRTSHDRLSVDSGYPNRESILRDSLVFDRLSVREAPDSVPCAKLFFACANSSHAFDFKIRRRVACDFSFSFFCARKFFHMQKTLMSSAFLQFRKILAQTRSCISEVQACADFANGRLSKAGVFKLAYTVRASR
jgi:hypothetical protein